MSRARPLAGLTIGIVYNVHLRMARGLARDAVTDADTLRTVDAACSVLRSAGARVADLAAGEDLRPLFGRLSRRRPHAVINLCDCPRGDSALEPAIPGMLDLLGIPYTGAPASALALCRDKATVKRILAASGIPTPAFTVALPHRRPVAKTRLPAFVKPVHEDASCGIDNGSVVRTRTALVRRVRFVHERYGQPALVERFIDGREVNVSIVGADPPRLLPLGEIDFSRLPRGLPRIVGFEAKWLEDRPEYRGTQSIAARPLPRATLGAIRRDAAAAFALTGCRDYARVDLRLDRRLRPFVLEVNPNPDLSPGAGLARAWERAGGRWPDLVVSIVRMALDRPRG